MTSVQTYPAWSEEKWRGALEADALKSLRMQAWRRFEASGFPTGKNEFWRYTSTTAISGSEFSRIPAPKLEPRMVGHLQKQLDSFKGFARLIFIDGWLFPQISDLSVWGNCVDFLPVKELVTHRPTAISMDAEKTAGFSALNTALFHDGVWLNVREGAAPSMPLLIYFLQTSENSALTVQLKHWITLGRKAKIKIFEWHDSMSSSRNFFNHEFYVRLADESALEHVRFQNTVSNSWLRSLTEVRCEKKSCYRRFDLELGGAVSRNEIDAALEGNGARCDLSGVVLGSAEQHFDTQTVMSHKVPETASDQSCRNLLSGKARAVFGGHVRVCPGAQKTDAHQVHKTLLLSDQARADTKPQLQIDADDVQCSHGAAIGQLDEDSLFYLQSRGLSRARAEKMLATGFVEHLLTSVSDDFLRTFLVEELEKKLNGAFA